MTSQVYANAHPVSFNYIGETKYIKHAARTDSITRVVDPSPENLRITRKKANQDYSRKQKRMNSELCVETSTYEFSNNLLKIRIYISRNDEF